MRGKSLNILSRGVSEVRRGVGRAEFRRRKTGRQGNIEGGLRKGAELGLSLCAVPLYILSALISGTRREEGWKAGGRARDKETRRRARMGILVDIQTAVQHVFYLFIYCSGQGARVAGRVAEMREAKGSIW